MTKKKTVGVLCFLLLLVLAIKSVFLKKWAPSLKFPEKLCPRDSKISNSNSNLAKLGAIAKEFGSVCHSRKCHAALESVIDKTERVPRIRHILWKTERASVYFANQLKTWMEIQPNWTYVLWRDKDLDAFVSKDYAGVLGKFRTLRSGHDSYMILHHLGGVYADLDYVLVRPLDGFLKYPATVPITSEAIAMVYFGMNTWPPPMLGNPALMMSEPQHPFFFFCILQLAMNPTQDIFEFAGPLGLSAMVKRYATDFLVTANPGGIVLVPPSRAFDAFANNSFRSSTTIHRSTWISRLSLLCIGVNASMSAPKPLKAYCKDVYNLDPITNKTDIAYARHDTKKTRTSYDPEGSPHFFTNTIDISGRSA